MRKLILSTLIVIAALGATAQDAKKGCNPKACGPDNTKVAEAAVITDLRTKVVELSKEVTVKGTEQEALIGTDEEESLELIASEVSRLAVLLEYSDFQASGTGAVLVNQLSTFVDKLSDVTNVNQ